LPQTPNTSAGLQVGGVGVIIQLVIKQNFGVLDISSATNKQIILKKPDGSSQICDASFFTDGQDGLIYYRTREGDLNLPGTYLAQAKIETPSFTGYSSQTSFVVSANL
jgi:hypothetical protein